MTSANLCFNKQEYEFLMSDTIHEKYKHTYGFFSLSLSWIVWHVIYDAFQILLSRIEKVWTCADFAFYSWFAIVLYMKWLQRYMNIVKTNKYYTQNFGVWNDLLFSRNYYTCIGIIKSTLCVLIDIYFYIYFSYS